MAWSPTPSISLKPGTTDMGVRRVSQLPEPKLRSTVKEKTLPSGLGWFSAPSPFITPSISSVCLSRERGLSDLEFLTSGSWEARSESRLACASAAANVSKVGIEWKPAQSQIFFRGGVGVRLNGDDSVVMRLRKGTFGLYMHRSF